MSQTGKAHIKLTLDIEYDLNGGSIIDLKDNLESMVELAMGNGQITGDTESEVDGYTFAIEEVEPTEKLKPKKPS